MAWPTTTISTTHLDNDADSPVLARPDIKEMADNVNLIKDALLDEDDLSSNSNTSIATQQSIKAYVDKYAKRAMQVFDVVNDYGAAADGTTNDLAAIQAAIDAAELAGGGIVLFPSAICAVSSAIIIDSPGVILVGQGVNSIIRTTSTAIDILQIKASAAVSNLTFRCLNAPTGGKAIKVQDDASVVLDNINIENTAGGLFIYESSKCVVNNLNIIQLHGQDGVTIGGASGDLAKRALFNNLTISQPYPVALTSHSQFKTWAATTAYSVGDVVVSSSAIYQCTTAGTSGTTTPTGKGSSNAASAFTTEVTDGTVGWTFVSHSALKLFRVNAFAYDVQIENYYGLGGAYGLVIEATTGTSADVPTRVSCSDSFISQGYLDNIVISAGHDIVLKDVVNQSCWQGKGVNGVGSNFSRLSIVGGLTSNCFEEGIHIGGCTDFHIKTRVGNNSASGSASFSGIRVGANSERFFIVESISGDITGGTNNQAYGVLIDEDASIDNYIVRDCILQDNVTGSLDDNSLSSTSSVGGNI